MAKLLACIFAHVAFEIVEAGLPSSSSSTTTSTMLSSSTSTSTGESEICAASCGNRRSIVCGGNGVEYLNNCHARCADERQATDGYCELPQIHRNVIQACIGSCSSSGNSVCRDGILYDNWCHASCYGVQFVDLVCDVTSSSTTTTFVEDGDSVVPNSPQASTSSDDEINILIISVIVFGVIVLMVAIFALSKFLRKYKGGQHLKYKREVKMKDLQNTSTFRHNKHMPLSPNFVENTDKLFNMKLKAKARGDENGRVSVKVTEMVKSNPTFGKNIPDSQWMETLSSDSRSQGDTSETHNIVMTWDASLEAGIPEDEIVVPANHENVTNRRESSEAPSENSADTIRTTKTNQSITL